MRLLLLSGKTSLKRNHFSLHTGYNLPDFNRSFLALIIGDFLQKALFKTLEERMKMKSKISLVSISFNDEAYLYAFMYFVLFEE